MPKFKLMRRQGIDSTFAGPPPQEVIEAENIVHATRLVVEKHGPEYVAVGLEHNEI